VFRCSEIQQKRPVSHTSRPHAPIDPITNQQAAIAEVEDFSVGHGRRVCWCGKVCHKLSLPLRLSDEDLVQAGFCSMRACWPGKSLAQAACLR